MITRAVCPVVVAREAEITRLEDSLLSAMRGDGNLVVLSGDAGIGKSRLAAELRRRAQKLRATVMEGGCSEAELAMPYLPFVEAIGNYLAGANLDSVRAQLGPARRELARLFPQLGDELAPTANASDGSQAKLRLYESLLGLLRIAAEGNGLLLIVEDLHWADDSTRELLDYIARRLRASRILLLISYRRDELFRKHPLLPTIQGWRRSRLADFIELEPLEPDGVGRMVSAIFDEPTREDTRDFLHARCEGNPFVLEEMLKVAMDRGDVYRTEGGWARKALAEIRLPATVLDSILLRVDRLGPEQSEVLRIAAVLGRSFEYQLLRDLCGRDVEDELEALAQQQLIEEEPGGRGRHRFRHALTQEAIYESLSGPRRERLHGQAAAALKKRKSYPAVDVAHHLLRANLQDEALPMLLRAADDAEAARAFREAAELRERALSGVADDSGRADLAGKIGRTLWLAGLPAAAMPYLDDAVEALTAQGLIAAAEHYRIVRGRVRWQHNRHDLAHIDFRRSVEALELVGPSPDLALALMSEGALYAVSQRSELAEPFLRRAVEVAAQAGADDVRIWSLQYLAVNFGHANDFEKSSALTEQSYREALAAGLVSVAESALNNLCACYLWWPRPRLLAMEIKKLRALGTEQANSIALQWESVAAHYSGDLTASLELARELHDTAQRLSNPRTMEIADRQCADVLSMMGRREEARPLVLRPNPDESLQVAQERALSWCRFHLASGESALAAEGALAVTADLTALVRGLPWLDCVMEALLAGDELEAARSVASAAAREPGYAQQPQLLLTVARFELAERRPARALELARRASEIFGRVGDHLDELIARIVMATALTEIGESEETAHVIERCITESRRMRAHYLEEKSVGLAGRLGIVVRDAPAEEQTIEVGEKLVTVLFADIRGYTAMTEEQPPAVMADRISAYQRWAKQEVERHRGMIDKFAGDAVMATFNASGATVDHTQHALETAIALRDRAALMDLQIGVGIAVGPAIVGRLADGANLSVIGETTNLASRLQGEAGPGEILLSAEAYRRLSGIRGRRERLELKGLRKRVAAYRLRT